MFVLLCLFAMCLFVSFFALRLFFVFVLIVLFSLTCFLLRAVVAPYIQGGSDSSDNEEETYTAADKSMWGAANAEVLVLHGCVACNEHVFHPNDCSLRCPKCGHPRFNNWHRPNEVDVQSALRLFLGGLRCAVLFCVVLGSVLYCVFVFFLLFCVGFLVLRYQAMVI